MSGYLASGLFRPTVTGIAIPTDLRAVVPSSLFADGMMAMMRNPATVFVWDPASVEVDNAATVIKPSDVAPASPGRWVVSSIGSGSGWQDITPFVSSTAGGAGSLTTTADLREVVRVGYPVRVFDRSGSDYVDTYGELSGFVAMTGVADLVDASGRLYMIQVVDDPPTNTQFHVEIYNRSTMAAGELVGHTAIYTTTGDKAIIEDNASGLGGQLTVDSIGDYGNNITVDFYKYFVCSKPMPTALTLRGLGLSTGAGDITKAWVGNPERVSQLTVMFPGLFALVASTGLIGSYNHSQLWWHGPPARVCYLAGYAKVASATPAKVNLHIAGSEVFSSSNSNDGLELTPSAIKRNTTTDVNIGSNRLEFFDSIECSTTQGATTSTLDSDATIQFVVVDE